MRCTARKQPKAVTLGASKRTAGKDARQQQAYRTQTCRSSHARRHTRPARRSCCAQRQLCCGWEHPSPAACSVCAGVTGAPRRKKRTTGTVNDAGATNLRPLLNDASTAPPRCVHLARHHSGRAESPGVTRWRTPGQRFYERPTLPPGGGGVGAGFHPTHRAMAATLRRSGRYPGRGGGLA
jgi:hypothetical protein